VDSLWFGPRDRAGSSQLVNPSADHGGNVYAAARESHRLLKHFCDFSASINPLGLPASARLALNAAVPLTVHYPDPDGYELREALAEARGIDLDTIVLGNGSTELIYALPSALGIRHGLVIGPTFTEYEQALIRAGGRCTYVFSRSNDSYAPPIDQVREILRRQRKRQTGAPGRGGVDTQPVDAIFLCNPNSPTGQMVPKEIVLSLLQDVSRAGGMLVVDEAFIDYCERHSVLGVAQSSSCLLVIRSFTKFFALPGLRVGYLVGAADTVARVRAVLPPWSVNVFAQTAAVAALHDQRYRRLSLMFMRQERPRFIKRLRGLSRLCVYPSRANFVLIELPLGLTASAVAQGLKKQGILVRDCLSIPGMNDRSLRVAVRRSLENDRLIAALKNVIKERK